MADWTTTTAQRRCNGRRRDGQCCESWAMTGSNFCIAHNASYAEELAVARSRGGLARHGREIGETGTAAPVKLESVADLLALLEDALNDARRLENSVSRGRAVSQLAATWLSAFTAHEIAGRVEALETGGDYEADFAVDS